MPHRKSKSNFPPEAQVSLVQIPPEFRAEAGFELLRSLSNTGERLPLRQLSKKEVPEEPGHVWAAYGESIHQIPGVVAGGKGHGAMQGQVKKRNLG